MTLTFFLGERYERHLSFRRRVNFILHEEFNFGALRMTFTE
jgi:hypothetical protein